MKQAFQSLILLVGLCNIGFASSIDYSFPTKFDVMDVIAEVKVLAVDKKYNESLKLVELTCECLVLRSFKGTKDEQKLSVSFYIHEGQNVEIGSEYLIFAFDHTRGLRTFGGFRGLTLKGQPYHNPTKEGYKRLSYSKLIEELEKYSAIANQVEHSTR